MLLSLRDSGADVVSMAKSRQTELEAFLKNASVGAVPAKSPEEKREAFDTLETMGIDPWSSEKVSKMRDAIEERKIGPETRYAKAYAFARAELKERNGRVFLQTRIPHEKQQWSLSCEANSMRDFVNHYRIANGE